MADGSSGSEPITNHEVVEAVRMRTDELCLGHDFLFHYDEDHEGVRICRLVDGRERELAFVQEYWIRQRGGEDLLRAAIAAACEAARER